MTATEDIKSDEKGEAVAVAWEGKTVPDPEAEKEPEPETETETDQQGMDFVTLGMFIIGRQPFCC
jgi:hypothetical protein